MDADLTDRTDDLRQTHGEFLDGNAVVILTDAQLDILRQFLEDVRAIGHGLDFVLERCVDYAPGYGVAWDNGGTSDQDDRLETLIDKLCIDLGFHQRSSFERVTKEIAAQIDFSDVPDDVADHQIGIHAVRIEKEFTMGVTVYAYSVEPGTSRITGFRSDMREVVDELRSVRAEILLEDDRDFLPPSEVYAFDLHRPDIDQMLAVLSGDAELGDLVLKNRRLVETVEGS